jgi:hypothetical protein
LVAALLLPLAVQSSPVQLMAVFSASIISLLLVGNFFGGCF